MAEETDSDAPDSAASPFTVMHYLLMGAGAFLGIVALMFAVIMMIRIPAMQTRVADAAAKVHKLEADLTSSRIEMKKLKDALKQEHTARMQAAQRHAAMSAQIVSDVSQIQTRLKIHPTLEQKISLSGSASAVPGTAPMAGSTANGKQPADQAKAMLNAIKKFNAR